MNYCPNCGNILNENDKFCSNCGYRLDESVDSTENIYGEVIVKQAPKEIEPLTKKHALSMVGFIFGIVSIVLLIIVFVLIGMYYDRDIPLELSFVGGLCAMFAFVCAAVGVGTSIPGLVISKKRNGPLGFAITSVVISGIPCLIVLILMVL